MVDIAWVAAFPALVFGSLPLTHAADGKARYGRWKAPTIMTYSGLSAGLQLSIDFVADRHSARG